GRADAAGEDGWKGLIIRSAKRFAKQEAIVGRKIGILAALLCFVLPLAASAQEQQQSLGDLARQLRKEKEKNSTQPKTVITDDSLPGKSGGGLNLDSSADAQTFTGGNSEAMDRAWAGLNRA